ncbi:DNA cytosine methyltransferase [Methanolapillus ohkumae]|uniref:DNA (cytosine-5-)-methyltransferase n=1 Tax=Methanolapillus ohkumae TaxID=3028298 RepID=A0AA96ZV95_9EURY|nr:Modification methylase HaeIII [Methanosarcinaceae archaeon Am2]
MIKAIDIFSGCGGVSKGLTMEGFQVVCAIEIESDAVSTFKSQKCFKKCTVLNKDIHDVSGTEIFEILDLKTNELYLLAGCPPCQKFSYQNRGRKLIPEEERKELLFQFLRIIEEIKPPFILMENVPGILSKDNKKILDEFIDRLRNRKNNYKIEYGILNAADYGVPQSRKRFVLHAVRKDIDEILNQYGYDFKLPEASHSMDGADGNCKWRTVKDAIGDLPPLKAGQLYEDEAIKNHKSSNLSDKNINKMKKIRRGGGTRTCLPKEDVLPCHKKHSGHKDVYGIMDFNKPAPTITGGCLSYSKGRFGHPIDNRAISIREAARLQTFPDDFLFSNSTTKAGLQIGNAVPIDLVRASAREIKKSIQLVEKNFQ